MLGYCGLGTLAAFIFAKYCAVYSLEAFSNSSGVLSQALLGGLFGTFGRGFDFRFGDPFFRRVPLAVVLVRFRFWLFGCPERIVSDRGTQFTSRFWKKLHESLGTKLDFSTAYHPQTRGQTERVNQILEDMLCTCVLSYGAKWEDCLPFAEFSYNNSYQPSLQMAPFEALYGRKCRTPLNWSESGDSQIFGVDTLRVAEEQVLLICEDRKSVV